MHRDDVKPAWNGGGRSGVWTMPTAQNTGHPTTKPLPMVRDWVRLFTKPGDTILDPCARAAAVALAGIEAADWPSEAPWGDERGTGARSDDL